MVNSFVTYCPVMDFSRRNINGWKKNFLYVFTTPDPRNGTFLFASAVAHNWMQQGTITFANGKIYRKKSRTIGGVTVWLFEGTEQIVLLVKEQKLLIELCRLINATPDIDFWPIAELALDRKVYPGWRQGTEERVTAHLQFIGLEKLEELIGLLRVGTAAGLNTGKVAA